MRASISARCATGKSSVGASRHLIFRWIKVRQGGKITGADRQAIMKILLLIFGAIVSIFVITGIFRAWIRRNRLFKENLERLGARLDKKIALTPKFDWNFKGLRTQYVHAMPREHTRNNIFISVFHQRQLNLGIHLTNALNVGMKNIERLGISSWYPFSMLRLSSKRFGAGEVELPDALKERLIKCYIANAPAGMHPFSDERIINSIVRLSDTIDLYDGEFIVNDSCVTMSFPADATLDSRVLDAAGELSMNMTSTWAVPALPPVKKAYDRVFNFFVIFLLLALIAVVIFVILQRV